MIKKSQYSKYSLLLMIAILTIMAITILAAFTIVLKALAVFF